MMVKVVCKSMSPATLPNCHCVVAHSTMVTTCKGDNSKAKKKPLKKKPEKKESKQPAKKAKVGREKAKGRRKEKPAASKASYDDNDNAARNLHSEASETNNEGSEFCDIMSMLLITCARASSLSGTQPTIVNQCPRGPSPPPSTNMPHCNGVHKEVAIQAPHSPELMSPVLKAAMEAHSNYLMMLKETGQLKAKGRGCPYSGYRHIPDQHIFCSILDVICLSDLETVGMAPVPRAIMRIYRSWKQHAMTHRVQRTKKLLMPDFS